MSEEILPEEIIELVKSKYKLSEIYDVVTTTDDGGRVLDVNAHFYEEAAKIRKILPTKFKGYKITVSYYTN